MYDWDITLLMLQVPDKVVQLCTHAVSKPHSKPYAATVEQIWAYWLDIYLWYKGTSLYKDFFFFFNRILFLCGEKNILT